jgi:hypothetical protein
VFRGLQLRDGWRNASGPGDDWYARGVAKGKQRAAAREINKIPAALPNENGQSTGPLA